jgi:hypothetical protein
MQTYFDGGHEIANPPVQTVQKQPNSEVHRGLSG